MEKMILITRCVMYYLLAVATPFAIANVLVGSMTGTGGSVIGYHPKATPIIAQQYKVQTLEERLRDLESGEYARRLATITNTNQAVVALETKLTGKVKETRSELMEAKIRLAQLTHMPR